MLKRLMLAIGCNEYENLARLRGAELDAREIFQILTSASQYDNAHSILLESPDLEAIRAAMEKILFDYGPIDTFTFYFAGHGAVRAGGYYLCPCDAQLDRLSATAVNIAHLFYQINEAAPRQTNIIIDACEAAGLVSDIAALLKPELVGKAGTPSITLFAASAANEGARETELGGLATVELLRSIRGEVVVSTQRPTLDLAQIGQVVSQRLPEGQTPTTWGLNLHGEARFCRNPHFNAEHSVLPPLSSLAFEPGSSKGSVIHSHSERIWLQYLKVDDEIRPRDLFDAAAPVLLVLDNDNEIASFVLGLADAFGARASRSPNTFAEAEVFAVMMTLLLPHINKGPAVGDSIKVLGERMALSAQIAIQELNNSMSKSKYAMLGNHGGMGDLFYLPLRITKILGWSGTVQLMLGRLGIAHKADLTIHRAALARIIEEYLSGLAAISDGQSPYLLTFLCACLRNGQQVEGARIAVRVYESLVHARGRIAPSDLEPKRVLEYLLRRNAGDFADAEDLLANPVDLLAVILLFAAELGIDENVDLNLSGLDHAVFNVFIPESHLDFGQDTILRGTNHAFQVGSKIWSVHEFHQEWVRSCIPNIKEDTALTKVEVVLGALAAAMVFGDRSPWFVAATD